MLTAVYDAYRIAILFCLAVRWLSPAVFLQAATGRPNPTFGVRLRAFLSAMGGAYVKLGQFLAIRFDILPPAICNELSRLMDDVPPEGFASVRRRIETELGGPLEAFFRSFDQEPLACASIAQVHRAVSRDGAELAVKVQRSAVGRQLAADLRNLGRLARFAARLSGESDSPMPRLAEEFQAFTLREIDFLREAETATRLQRESLGFVRIPRVRWDLTTRAVLCMDLIDGVSLLKVCQCAEAGCSDAFAQLLPGLSPNVLLRRLAWACLHQQFVTGRFHGDPHLANLMIDREGRIVFVDFGIFGELDPVTRETLASYVREVAHGRLRLAFGHLTTLVTIGPETDVGAFRHEAIALLRRWRRDAQSGGVTDRPSVKFQFEMLSVMRRYGVQMKQNQVLFWRAQAMLDATASRLPVDFDLLNTLSEFLSAQDPDVFGAARAPELSVALGGPLSAALRLPRGLAHGALRLRSEHRHIRAEVNTATRPRRQAAGRTSLLAAALAAVSAMIVLHALALSRLHTRLPPATASLASPH
jgi:ubiquinone biosynthesis protein